MYLLELIAAGQLLDSVHRPMMPAVWMAAPPSCSAQPAQPCFWGLREGETKEDFQVFGVSNKKDEISMNEER